MAPGFMRLSLAGYLAGYGLKGGALFPVGLALMALAPSPLTPFPPQVKPHGFANAASAR
jgi:hypothetical protein